MQICATTLSAKEVEEFLRQDNFVPGTMLYIMERNRRYRQCELNEGQFVERDDWDGQRNMLVLVAGEPSVEPRPTGEVDVVAQQAAQQRMADFDCCADLHARR